MRGDDATTEWPRPAASNDSKRNNLVLNMVQTGASEPNNFQRASNK